MRYSIITLLAAIGLTACTSTTDETVADTYGRALMGPLTRAEGELDGFVATLSMGRGVGALRYEEIQRTDSPLTDWPQDKEFTLHAGNFCLELFSENYEDATVWAEDEAGQPVYHGATYFRVVKDSTTHIGSVIARQVNIGVRARYDAEMQQRFPHKALTVTAGNRTYAFADNDTLTTAYVPAADSLTYTLLLTNEDEEQFTHTRRMAVTGGKNYLMDWTLDNM